MIGTQEVRLIWVGSYLFTLLGTLLGKIKTSLDVVDVCGLLSIGRASIQQAPLAPYPSPKDNPQEDVDDTDNKQHPERRSGGGIDVMR